MPMRWRWPPEKLLRVAARRARARGPTSSQQLAHASAGPRPRACRACAAARRGCRRPACRGSSEASGSWKTTCMSRRSARRSARARASAVSRAEHDDPPGLRRGQLEHLASAWWSCRSRTRRPAPSVSPSRDVEADAVDRVHGADLALEDRALQQRVVLDEVRRPRSTAVALARAAVARRPARARRGSGSRDRRRSAAPARRRSISSAAVAGGQRAGRVPDRDSSARLDARAQASTASGQRGANGQPGGSAAERRRVALDRRRAAARPARPARGIEPSSPIVYGIRGR